MGKFDWWCNIFSINGIIESLANESLVISTSNQIMSLKQIMQNHGNPESLDAIAGIAH